MLQNPFILHASPRTPTVVELLAAERLMPQLRDAMQYTLAIVAARQPSLLPLHARANEAWLLITLALETHCLRTVDASFTESFYGLRRAGVGSDGRLLRLTTRQRCLSLLGLVLLPYLRAKLLDARAESTGARRALALRQAAAREPVAPAALQPLRSVTEAPAADPPRTRAAAARALAARLVGAARRLAGAASGWLDGAVDVERFCWQLCHAFGVTRQWSSLLALARLELVRRTPGDEVSLAAASAASAAAAAGGALGALGAHAHLMRRLVLAGGARSPLRSARALLRALLRALQLSGALALEHARNGLVALVIGIKILHWWYAPQPDGGRLAFAPIPPPPALAPAAGGVALPAEKDVCPACRLPRANATLAPSGYVFCYRCIFEALERDGHCPVTLMPAGVPSLRKIYEAEPP